ncbi:hypothetical protein PM082_013209 [Marasmius tenuissimus]|nr:hypothetical protein PM082_013209 [Marasmius tenuissimus]
MPKLRLVTLVVPFGAFTPLELDGTSKVHNNGKSFSVASGDRVSQQGLQGNEAADGTGRELFVR